MQDIHRFVKLRHIKDPMAPALIPHPDFVDPNADCGQRLPVIWLFALLHLKELIPCELSNIVGKVPKIIS